MSKVIVKAFADGAILRPSSKAEGRVIFMVAQSSWSNIGGAYFESSRRAILNLPAKLAESLNLQDGVDFNALALSHGLKEVEIVRTEQLTPFYEGQEPKINPTTKEVVRDASGAPIYMQDKAEDKGTKKDVLVASAGQTANAEATTSEAEAGDHA